MTRMTNISTSLKSHFLGGNQREIDRQRALNRAKKSNNQKKEDGVSLAAKKEKDAAIMREKQKKAQEAKQ